MKSTSTTTAALIVAATAAAVTTTNTDVGVSGFAVTGPQRRHAQQKQFSKTTSTTTMTTTTKSTSTSTSLNGLFDGVKEAFSAPPTSQVGSERETPIDRWMGWSTVSDDAASNNAQPAGTSRFVVFLKGKLCFCCCLECYLVVGSFIQSRIPSLHHIFLFLKLFAFRLYFLFLKQPLISIFDRLCRFDGREELHRCPIDEADGNCL